MVYATAPGLKNRRRGAVGAYTTRIGKLTERYVLQLVESAHQEPRLPGAGKVHGDKKFANGIDSSDISITYPNEAVLMEVASHRLTVESKRDGDQQALERDLTEMVARRPKQLRRSIELRRQRLLPQLNPTDLFRRDSDALQLNVGSNAGKNDRLRRHRNNGLIARVVGICGAAEFSSRNDSGPELHQSNRAQYDRDSLRQHADLRSLVP